MSGNQRADELMATPNYPSEMPFWIRFYPREVRQVDSYEALAAQQRSTFFTLSLSLSLLGLLPKRIHRCARIRRKICRHYHPCCQNRGATSPNLSRGVRFSARQVLPLAGKNNGDHGRETTRFTSPVNVEMIKALRSLKKKQSRCVATCMKYSIIVFYYIPRLFAQLTRTRCD